MENTINELILNIDIVEKQLREYVKDKTIDLDTRWNLFCKFCKATGRGNDIINPNFDDFSWFHNKFYNCDPSRYQFFKVTKFIIEKEWLKYEDKKEDYLEQEPLFKEYCLKNFLYSFVFDW